MTASETDREPGPPVHAETLGGDRAVPRLHLITDDSILGRSDFTAMAHALVAAGGTDIALHIRGPSTDGRTLHRRATDLRTPTRTSGSLLVVNDRVDVAIAAGADAVQLSARSLDPDLLLEAAASLAVGVSVHGIEEASNVGPVDWFLVGTIYPTPSHPGRRVSGPRLPGAVATVTSTPAIAIGGVTPERVPEVMRAGAWGVAVMRGVWRAADPIEALHRYLEVAALDPTSDSPPTP